MRLDQRFQLLDLAGADVRGDIHLLSFLEQAADHRETGRLGKAPDLIQGVVGRDITVGQQDPNQNRFFPTVQTLGALEFDQGGNPPL